MEEALLPSAQRLYGTNYLFMRDNDPKYTSRKQGNFFAENGVELWKTPPESPIENLWHELKEYIHRQVKPKTKADLLSGFGGKVDRHTIILLLF